MRTHYQPLIEHIVNILLRVRHGTATFPVDLQQLPICAPCREGFNARLQNTGVCCYGCRGGEKRSLPAPDSHHEMHRGEIIRGQNGGGPMCRNPLIAF